MRFVLASYVAVLALSAIDAITTMLAVGNDIGYEVNPFVKILLLNNNFLILKIAITGIAFAVATKILDKNLRVLKACYLSVITFYSLIIINNLGVITCSFDLNLDMGKMVAIVAVLFLLYFKAIQDSQRQP